MRKIWKFLTEERYSMIDLILIAIVASIFTVIWRVLL